jgi:hypothetical protein
MYSSEFLEIVLAFLFELSLKKYDPVLLDREMSNATVTRHYGVNGSTVIFIKKKEVTISRSVQARAQSRAKICC